MDVQMGIIFIMWPTVAEVVVQMELTLILLLNGVYLVQLDVRCVMEVVIINVPDVELMKIIHQIFIISIQGKILVLKLVQLATILKIKDIFVMHAKLVALHVLIMQQIVLLVKISVVLFISIMIVPNVLLSVQMVIMVKQVLIYVKHVTKLVVNVLGQL
jgi:hypothetical protein